MQIAASNRNEKQNRVIKLALEEVTFFKKMIEEQGGDLFQKCMNRMKLLQMQKEDVVFKNGKYSRSYELIALTNTYRRTWRCILCAY